MKANIKLRTIGKIISGGESDEKYILILDDFEETGGYYIYTCTNSSFDNCYDGWALNDDELMINTSDYLIEWDEDIKLPKWCTYSTS